MYIFHQFLQHAFRAVSGDRLPRLKAYATRCSAIAPKLKKGHVTKTTPLPGVHFHAWLVLADVYQRTKSKRQGVTQGHWKWYVLAYIAIHCKYRSYLAAIFELFDVENIATLKSE